MILSFQRNKFKVLPMVLAAILVSLIFIPVRSCKKDTEEPIYTKLARMGGGWNNARPDGKWQWDTVVNGETQHWLTVDTTKKPNSQRIKVKYNHYKLDGSDTLFQLLYLQVQSPLDVTPRQLQTIKNWLNTNIKIDSTQ